MTEVPNELVLTRLIDAPREKLFRCWTEPRLLKQWFAPAPVTTPVAEVDLRIGGANFIVMRMPDGQEIPCPGVYLEIIPNQKLVFTDAYSGDWLPKTGGKPFMTVILTFEEEKGQTRYAARVGANAPISSPRWRRRSDSSIARSGAWTTRSRESDRRRTIGNGMIAQGPWAR
jgi:uncharacterized protein YndB with AHSA1/START domain